MSIPNDILDIFNQHKGELVITESHKVERLLAIGDDEEDYYWITWDMRKTTWSTCVGTVYPLKGYLPDKDYQRLLHAWILNDPLSPNLFGKTNPDIDIQNINEEAKNEILALKGKDKYVTDICFEIR